MTDRCGALQPGTGFRCGLWVGHDGEHTVLTPSAAQWFGVAQTGDAASAAVGKTNPANCDLPSPILPSPSAQADEAGRVQEIQERLAAWRANCAEEDGDPDLVSIFELHAAADVSWLLDRVSSLTRERDELSVALDNWQAAAVRGLGLQKAAEKERDKLRFALQVIAAGETTDPAHMARVALGAPEE